MAVKGGWEWEERGDGMGDGMGGKGNARESTGEGEERSGWVGDWRAGGKSDAGGEGGH